MKSILMVAVLVLAGCECGSPMKPPGWVVQEQENLQPSIYVNGGEKPRFRTVVFIEHGGVGKETVIAKIDCRLHVRHILNRKLYREAVALYHQRFPQKDFTQDLFLSCPSRNNP